RLNSHETIPPDVHSRRRHHRPHARVFLPRRREAVALDRERPRFTAERAAPGRRLVCAPADGDQGGNQGNAPASNQGTPHEELFRGCVSGAFSEGTEGRIRAPPENWKWSHQRFRFRATEYFASDRRSETAAVRQRLVV